ncbi:TetR family transcriptional regulator [Stackebrandtia albiflava]|uniref:TetR family transcriptional regulator n=1 Tax=Stackebrandtia albiflava TaxID=406432 RepID=A0A562V2S7_9ACTN|nr:TetR/AcrR family transcriptional regulator [Stackebrandtia albiflava]TWJ12196.1 TetR family transcriptional regulator [Stackebrandtia albiflava]
MGNREALLGAAKKCLFEKGFDRTTVRDLASAAGVSMAAIGYHFGSKEALLNEALFDMLGSGDAIGRSVAAAGEADAEDSFRALWAGLIESFSHNRTFWLANLEAVMRGLRDPELGVQLNEGQRQGRSGMAALVTRTPEDDLPDSTVRTVGAVQMALIAGMMIHALSDPDTVPDVDEFLAGLRELGRHAG